MLAHGDYSNIAKCRTKILLLKCVEMSRLRLKLDDNDGPLPRRHANGYDNILL